MKQFLKLNILSLLSSFISVSNFIVSAIYFGANKERDLFVYGFGIISLVQQLLFGAVFENIRYSLVNDEIRLQKEKIVGRTVALILMVNLVLVLIILLLATSLSHNNFESLMQNSLTFTLTGLNTIFISILLKHKTRDVILANIFSGSIVILCIILSNGQRTMSFFVIMNYIFIVCQFLFLTYCLYRRRLLQYAMINNPFRRSYFVYNRRILPLYINFFIGQIYRLVEIKVFLIAAEGGLSIIDYVRRAIDFVKNFLMPIVNEYVVKKVVLLNSQENILRQVRFFLTIPFCIYIAFLLGIYFINISELRLADSNSILLEFISNKNNLFLVSCTVLLEIVNYTLVSAYYSKNNFKFVAFTSSIQMLVSALLYVATVNLFSLHAFFIGQISSFIIIVLIYWGQLKFSMKYASCS